MELAQAKITTFLERRRKISEIAELHMHEVEISTLRKPRLEKIKGDEAWLRS